MHNDTYLYFFKLKKIALCKERQTDTCSAHLHFSGVVEAWLPYILLQMDFESLFGASSRGVQLPAYLWGRMVLLYGGRSSFQTKCATLGGMHM